MAVAVVIGAARGIGASVARALAEAGWDLVLGDVCADDLALAYSLGTLEQLNATADTCRALGATVHAGICDARVEQSVRDLLAAGNALGPVHAVVYVAGVLGGSGPAWTVDDATIERDMAVNFRGVVHAARAGVDQLLAAAPQGRFVAVLSAAAHRGLPQLSSYAASKHAALGYLRSLAVELAPLGVTVNAVSPGSTDTDILRATAAVYDLGDPKEFAVNQRIARLLSTEEIASAVAWLVSPGASGVTGSVVTVDGLFTG
jgi:SDR family mycofactocin-dependent oxidoreductase